MVCAGEEKETFHETSVVCGVKSLNEFRDDIPWNTNSMSIEKSIVSAIIMWSITFQACTLPRDTKNRV